MTLEDYARAYTFRAATITMARHISPRLGWCVRNAANQNHLCPVDGCVWPAGSKCTYSHCPERFTDNRTAFSSRACAAEAGFNPGPASNPLQNLSHACAHTGDPA